MSNQQLVNDLRASLDRSKTQLQDRLNAFSNEATSRVGSAQTRVGNSLDLLSQIFTSSLAGSEASRLDMENLNSLLSKQVGSAGVQTSRFANPKVVSSFQASKPRTFGRREATGASSNNKQLIQRFGA